MHKAFLPVGIGAADGLLYAKPTRHRNRWNGPLTQCQSYRDIYKVCSIFVLFFHPQLYEENKKLKLPHFRVDRKYVSVCRFNASQYTSLQKRREMPLVPRMREYVSPTWSGENQVRGR